MSTNNTTAGRAGSAAATGRSNMLINILAFAIFTMLWLLFGAALLLDRDALDGVWEGLRGLPWPLEAIAWLLLLPVVASLWIWEMDWSLWLRLLLVAGIAVANIVAFYPWRSQRQQGA
jgi:hypothetical protein